ncbi:MAG: exodeoxyribonuclease VII large subunit [Chloroflexi bacterium]|nr:exodeoxyribonuclease VII large subunit [Chloroflexota bacterium]GIW09822.1 MAG: exodeoxyribonuclease 7 large subunit [Dehalococcoidia bacterium]
MNIFSVGDLVAAIRRTLQHEPLFLDCFVEGEISNLYRSPAGHLYFTLKDEQAALRCVFFRAHARAQGLADGDQVVVHGHLSVYEPRGEVQIVVDLVQPAGLGILRLRFEQLKAKLEAEGLFDPARKRPLPPFPQRIGLITSPAGAVLHDIQTIISRRYPLVELVLAPCQVQGDEAVPQILAALEQLNARDDIDLIILARGGGSAEDLWCFNDERLARAIFASRIPVVSAVGHETDFTLVDFVADLRAPTPSAAAELCVPDLGEVRDRLAGYRSRLQGELATLLAERTSELRLLRHRLDRAAPDLDRLRQRLDELGRRLSERVASDLRLSAARLEGVAQRLGALDPRQTLARGYALIENPSRGCIVRGVADVAPGERVRVRLVDGRLEATVATVDRVEEQG